jgi:putative ABC transport system permease protein
MSWTGGGASHWAPWHSAPPRPRGINPADTSGIAVQAARGNLRGTVRSGAFLNAATGRCPAVVLGSVAAARLGIAEAGAHVWIAGRPFLVTGVLNTLSWAPRSTGPR